MDKAEAPYVFDEFFASGKEESISPFLTPDSRKWSKNLTLKSALFSAVLLATAFTTSFFHPLAADLMLIFVYFLVGTPALLDSIDDLKNLTINIDVLMTLAALLSIIIGSGMEGALLLVLFELSASMENAVTKKTQGALLTLHQLSPRTACVVEPDGTVHDRSVKEIKTGTTLLVKAGEIIPLDGVVLHGSSFVNLSHLTGENQPAVKKATDEVPAGAYNLDGTLTISVTRTSADSTLSRIIHLITQAQEAKPKLERMLDRFGKWYAISIILLACFFALVLPFLFSIPYLGNEGGIYRALAFLIAASPCALIIATPTAYLSAISSCAKKGILLKGGVVLDALAKCSIVAFDKTGTLTTGKLVCSSFEPLGTEVPICDIATALAIAASLERHAVHPIADAIISFAQERKAPLFEIEGFKSVPGSGLQGIVSLSGAKTKVYIGHPSFITSKVPHGKELRDSIEKMGHLNTVLLIGGTLFVFYFIDAIRPGIAEALQRLKKRDKLKLIMLTGDHTESAQTVAKELQLDECYSNLRPEDKLDKVALFSLKGGLAMVGDGINDAPALARATVGISMGKVGSATAVDASDIVFLQDDLSLLDWLFQKSRLTISIVRQNLILACLVILFATTPALLGLVPLWMAVVLHEGGTVLVGLNSLRLLRR